MASKTELCNMTISNLGIGKEIADIVSDKSEEAAACRRYYDAAMQAVIQEHDWSFASATATLALVESNPTTEWAYSYRYPSNCLKVRRIFSGMRLDTKSSQIPFKLGRDATGVLIYTDDASPEIEYTYNETDTNRLSGQLQIAFSFKLAALIAPRSTGGDPFKLKQEMLAQYMIELGAAKANDLNEGQQDKQANSEFITTRY